MWGVWLDRLKCLEKYSWKSICKSCLNHRERRWPHADKFVGKNSPMSQKILMSCFQKYAFLRSKNLKLVFQKTFTLNVMESKLSKFQLSSSEAKIFSTFGTLDTFLTGGNFSRQICPRGVTPSPYCLNNFKKLNQASTNLSVNYPLSSLMRTTT